MSESGAITVAYEGGYSVVDIATAASIIASIAISVGVSTNQAYCITSDLSKTMKKAFSIYASDRAEAFSIYPALAVPSLTTRNPINNLSDLIRHGIVVETVDPETNKNIYFYIGGVSNAWINDKRTQELFVTQGGTGFGIAKGKLSDQIQYTLSSNYPIIIVPLKSRVQNFKNPPSVTCSQSLLSQVLNYMQSASLWWATFIPNYVGAILFWFSTYNINNFYGSSNQGKQWYLTGTVKQLIQAISGTPPLFYSGLATLPQLDQFGLGNIQINNFDVFDFTNSNPPFARYYLTYPFPLLNGAPVYTDMICKGGDNCSGLSIAGFVVAPGGLSWYNPETVSINAQLIPPPNDFSFNGIMQYASQLGQYTWVDSIIQDIRKAFKVISILVTNFGWLEQQAEKVVYALEWFGAEFEKTAEEIAQDIVNEFNSSPHNENQHTDQAGQEVHNAYMCARFGICRY
jgi:hypothetical protein